MTECAYLWWQIDRCTSKAINLKDIDLKTFYARAKCGFEKRLLESSVDFLSKESENIKKFYGN